MAYRRWLVLAAGGLLCLVPPHAWANPAQERLAAMSEVDRSAALAIVVESSGQVCRAVARTFFQGEDEKGNVFWNVECSGGQSYVVQIKNDLNSSTRVLTCGRFQAVSGAACFKPF